MPNLTSAHAPVPLLLPSVNSALSKLQYLYALTDLNRKTLPWGDELDAMVNVL